MCVDLLSRRALIETDESMQEILARRIILLFSIAAGPTIVREKAAQRTVLQFLGKEIDLVEEEYDGSLDEPSRVTDRVEEGQGFLHSVHCGVFVECLIVFGEGDEEYEGGDVFETVDPFLTLAALATDVEESVG